MAENGTGFQYLWKTNPEINPYVGTIGSYIGISAMLFFAINILDLNQKAKRAEQFLICAFKFNLNKKKSG